MFKDSLEVSSTMKGSNSGGYSTTVMGVQQKASSSSTTSTACAACKYQRRKCTPDCPLSPYFPPDQPKRFANVHRLFGVSSILRLLKHVDPSKRDDTVKSITYEADTREKDPVHGCLGVITVLQNQVSKLKEELNIARQQLFMMEQQQAMAAAGQQLQSFQSPHGLLGESSYEDYDSQLLRYHIGSHEDDKFDQKLNILPLDYRYGGEDTPMMNLTKADQVEQHRRTGACFGMDPESHRQTHSQAAHDQGSRSSPNNNLAGYGIIPEGDIKGANYLLTSGQCHVLDHELRRAGVYLSLTN